MTFTGDRMIEQTHKVNQSILRWWPFFVGGLCAPLAGHLLHKLLPLPFAVAIAAFVMWLIVGWVINRRLPSTKRSMMLVAGIAVLAAVAVGVMASLFPWE